MGTVGTVKFFDEGKGYGFVRIEGEPRDIIIHHTAIQMAGYRTLAKGQRVSLDVLETGKGLSGRNVLPILESDVKSLERECPACGGSGRLKVETT